MAEEKTLASGTLVIGLGRFGSAVALTLDKLGYEVLAVEKDSRRVQQFSGRIPVVEADASSMEALNQLGARDFYSAVVGIGSSLEASVLITANLVDIGMTNIWAKAISREHSRILPRVRAFARGATRLLADQRRLGWLANCSRPIAQSERCCEGHGSGTSREH